MHLAKNQMLALLASTLAVPARRAEVLGVDNAPVPETHTTGTCNCSGVADKPSDTICHARGDPHYLTFDGEIYNFMAPGVYQLAHSTTSCGCEVEVQAFMMAILPHPVASFNVAIAMKVGEALFVIKSNLEMMATAPDGVPVTMLPAEVPAAGVKIGSAHVHVVCTMYKSKPVSGYKISIPGGGYLLTYAWQSPWDGLPNGHLYGT